ncbi:MAG: glycoside hydrolase family 32 protein [Acidobacteriota bacterium]|nr:glycoside hydrolase family 32 protein [Acidobacteriota bacterium]
MEIDRRVFGRRSFLRACTRAGIASALLPGLAGEGWSLADSVTPETSHDPAHDPLRPQYHLLPQHNWMNDPNGPIWWKGKYHLFYQLNPHAAVWGDMHWGHAVSTDMVHWHHEPIALAPTPGGPDSEGCFSGSAVVYKGVPTVIYTGVQNAPPQNVTLHDAANKLRETQMLATAADDNLLRWKKLDAPVIAAPPAGMAVTGFRDPCPWQEADGWYLGVGSGERGKGGCVLLYRSQDLRHWEYLHPLAQGKPTGSSANDPVDSGDMWECPDFFEVDGRHCLLYSTERKVYWTTGDYDVREHRYTPTRQGILDYGAYYAPKSFLAPDGRRILWGWIPERRPEAEFSSAGWAGAMSLPRVLGVDADGQLTMKVAAEAEKLRGASVRQTLKSGTHRQKLESLRQEIALRLTPQTKTAAVRLLVAGQPAWQMQLDLAGHTAHCGDRSFPLPALKADEPAVRLFLDASVIEAFAGATQAITGRCYTVQSGLTELEVAVDAGGGGELTRWPLAAISENRLTA